MYTMLMKKKMFFFLYTVALPFIWQDMMSSENAFPSRAHCLCRWYGLRDFVVLAAAPHMEDIISESRISMLLSSLSIAANNTGWLVIQKQQIT